MSESETCRKILVSKEQYLRLRVYIYDSFQKDGDGHFIKIKTTANYGKSDAFYEANGSYCLFCTCNTWANNALKASGQKSCWWTAFDTEIFLKYEWSVELLHCGGFVYRFSIAQKKKNQFNISVNRLISG